MRSTWSGSALNDPQSRTRPAAPAALGLRVLRNVAGGLLILIGIAWGFLPLLPGWVAILLGLALLDFPRKRRWVLALERWLRRREHRRHPLFLRLRRRLRRLAAGLRSSNKAG